MKIQCHPHEENPRLLLITVDGEEYREVLSSFFKEALNCLPIDLPNFTEVDEWFFSLEMRLAKKQAFYLLGLKSYPKSQLRKKFEDCKISSLTIDQLLIDLEKWGYLNDEEWIGHFITKEINKGYGPLIIRMKLQEKKIDEEKIERFLQQTCSEKKERKVLATLLEKRYASINCSIYQEKQRLMAKLQRRGFTPSVIVHVVETFFAF